MATEVNYAPADGEPVRLQALEVTHGLLPMLGVAPGSPGAGSRRRSERRRTAGRR